MPPLGSNLTKDDFGCCCCWATEFGTEAELLSLRCSMDGGDGCGDDCIGGTSCGRSGTIAARAHFLFTLPSFYFWRLSRCLDIHIM